jgi:carbonic anhydrase
LTVKKPGRFTVTATVENIKKTLKVQSKKNPVKSLSLSGPKNEIRTGDVIDLDAKALNSRGQAIKDVPISYSYAGTAIYSMCL